ncbi:rubrerythrin [Paenibacillus sp. LBL]|uniref:ferritin-like domain-containing protein n=1 Tax=Paenibacillus sp. LBL TaxID=2940563 RepID=UPI00247661DA|nr:ferritin-like domain-containing protein [Paenibacillus sp. LBL]MDH6672512.1 rubrerythrin [Paenibacillus sp. LBL]
MYSSYYSYNYRVDAAIIADLQKAINGEYSAIHCYEHLAQVAPNEKVRNQILEIRNDEIKHYHTFSNLYTTLTGRQPEPQLNETCPREYREGIEFAFKDEQNTVDYYLEVSDRTTDPVVKEAFKRAAADEQQHAVWFLYFIQQ